MTRSFAPSTLGCMILATAACGGSLSENRLPSPESQELTVEVRNHNHNAITVYAYRAQGCLLTELLPVEAGDDLLLIVRVIDNRDASQAQCR